MNIFAPYDTFFADSAKVLDNARLLKQVLEATQIAECNLIATDRITTTPGKYDVGWRSHPAVLAWRDSERGTVQYANQCLIELKTRKTPRGNEYKVSGHIERITFLSRKVFGVEDLAELASLPEEYPVWWSDPRIHRAYRAMLLSKDFEYYKHFLDDESDLIDEPSAYWWPCLNEYAGPDGYRNTRAPIGETTGSFYHLERRGQGLKLGEPHWLD